MNHDVIFVNGDSYSTGTETYADFLSEKLGIPVKNYAQLGSNNKRIIRSSIEYLEELQKTFKIPW